MRFIYFILLLLIVTGCSSSTSHPVTPVDAVNDSRVGFSDVYHEDSYCYVDVNIQNVSKLYQFSMRIEYDPDCIELIGFEPSDRFGPDTMVLFERIKSISENLKSEMRNPGHNLLVLAATRAYPHMGDINSPKKLGRIKFNLKCHSLNRPFEIFSHPEYLVFRNKDRKRIDVKPVDRIPDEGGDG